MSESINSLLELVDEFPKRVRIDYDENADRVFCNNVLTALKKAAPEIRALMLTSPFFPPVVGGLPSISTQLTQEEVSSNHTPTFVLGSALHSQVVEVVGTGEVADHKLDIVGIPGSGAPTPAVEDLGGKQESEPELKTLATTKARRRGKRSVTTSTQRPGHD